MAGYVTCPYTPEEWRNILRAASCQLLEMRQAVGQVLRLEKFASRIPPAPGYDPYPIDVDANAVMQSLMNTKWGNLLGDIGSSASEALFRYKFSIAPGKPTAYTLATVSDYSANYTQIAANDGDPFAQIYAHTTQGDMVTITWIDANGVTRTFTSKTARSIVAAANTLVLNELLNPSLVVDGGFSGSTDWTEGDGTWVIGGGVATATVSSATLTSAAAITVETGVTYQITFTMTRSAGTLGVSFDGVLIDTKNSSDTYTVEFTATDTSGVLTFTGTGFTGTLDSVSLREKMPSANTSVTVTLEATYVP